MSDDKTSKLSRRKLLKGGAITAGVGVASLAMPQISRAETFTLRMQSSWPAADVFHEMAADYVERVEAMAGGRLKIDLTPAGAIVGAFQVQDACADGVIDIAHTVPVYWYGKHKAASLFGTGPVWGGSAGRLTGGNAPRRTPLKAFSICASTASESISPTTTKKRLLGAYISR